MSRKIALLAPTGQVGFELNRQLQSFGEVVTVTRENVDFLDLEAIYHHIDKICPDIIVNAAAYTAVDKAESDKANAFTLNRDLPRVLAELSIAHDAWLVHYSSDYVYPGNGSIPWIESDSTGPLNVYGQSKLEGDLAIERIASKYLIFRTSWVYAARGNNFLLSMLKLGKERDSLDIVNDQIGAPTSASLIATVSTLCLQKAIILDSAQSFSGIYHLASKGHTNWYNFATKIFDEARARGLNLTLRKSGLAQISSTEYPTPAKRPQNSRLNLNKIETKFGVIMPTWESQLSLTIEELLDANSGF